MKAAFNTGWARAASLGTSLVMMVLITVFPHGLTAVDGSPIRHGMLVLIMWGLSAGFVHGVGFVPCNPVLRGALGPLIAWPSMGLGLLCYLWYFLR